MKNSMNTLKASLLTVLSLLATTAHATAMAADASLVKSCSTVLSSPDSAKSVPTIVDVFADGGVFTAKITQTPDGQTGSYSDTAEVSLNKVRAGLNADSINGGDLNIAERLIAHAMSLTDDPIFKGAFSAGLDLSAVRAAKVYLIGKPSNMGATAIVEAQDELGKDLGSFLGGFLVSACK